MLIKGGKHVVLCTRVQLIPQLLYTQASCNIQGGLEPPTSEKIFPLENFY